MNPSTERGTYENLKVNLPDQDSSGLGRCSNHELQHGCGPDFQPRRRFGAQLRPRRLNEDGSPDITFGSEGKVVTDGYGFELGAVAVQADGKIVVAGAARGPRSTDFALARYNADGTVDETFGNGGPVITDFGRSEFTRALALQPDGKILAAGGQFPGTYGYSPTRDGDIMLARYNADGSLDTTFGTAGGIATDFGASEWASALAIQADGKILLVGGAGVARYDPNGALDTFFGLKGGFTDFLDSQLSSLGIQSDGRIVVAGGYGAPSPRAVGAFFQEDFFVARVHSDGSVDRAFGNTGQVRTSFAVDGRDSASGLAIQTDGKIVVAGSAGAGFIGCDEGYPGAPDFALARYNTDGSLDTSFGAGGQVITSFTDYDGASTINIQTDGKILVAGGTLRLFGLADFALALYISDGSLEVSELRFEPSTIVSGDSFIASFSGPDLTGAPLFDVRFRRPGSDTDEVVLNWQLGASAPHTVAHDVPPGIWTVTGVRAHRNIGDPTRFLPVRAELIVTPPK